MKVATILAFIGTLMNGYLAGEYSGYRNGYEQARKLTQECMNFQISGSDGFLINTHLILTLLFVVFLIGLHIKKKRVHLVICIMSLLALIMVYFRWVGLMFLNSELTFFDNVSNSVTVLDIVSVTIVLALVLYQVYAFTRSKTSRTPS